MTNLLTTDDRVAAMRAAAERIGTARSVLLLAHKNPDADALGSALALGLAVQRNGGQAVVCFDAPAQVSPTLAGLPGIELVQPAADWLPGGAHGDTPLDLIVVLDSGSLERVGRFADQFHRAPVLVIDHHLTNTGYGDHHLIDRTADSTTLLVAEVLQHMGCVFDKQIAELLYAGLCTDTGNFRRASARGLRLAADLIDSGAQPVPLMTPISDSHPFGWLPMLAAVLGRAQLRGSALGGRGLVSTTVTSHDLVGLRQAEAEAVIDILRTCTDAAVAVVCKQSDPHTWQISLRARPDVQVATVAVQLGGGGHASAAGFTWVGEPSAAVDAVVAALSDVPS